MVTAAAAIAAGSIRDDSEAVVVKATAVTGVIAVAAAMAAEIAADARSNYGAHTFLLPLRRFFSRDDAVVVQVPATKIGNDAARPIVAELAHRDLPIAIRVA